MLAHHDDDQEDDYGRNVCTEEVACLDDESYARALKEAEENGYSR